MTTTSSIEFIKHQTEAVAHINNLINLLSYDESQRTTILYLKDARAQLNIAESRYAYNKQRNQ